jgi:hypothetical protein
MAHEHGSGHFPATGDGSLLRRRIEVAAVRRNGDEFPVELEVMPIYGIIVAAYGGFDA